jgi:hypothetical protein
MKLSFMNKRTAYIAVALAALLVFPIANGLCDIYITDVPLGDGDFQNYNTVRRLLAGQVPFTDFAVYLGMGQVLTQAALQLLFGNNFTMSQFVTAFLCFGFFEVFAFAAGYLVFRNKNNALCFTAALSLLNFICQYIRKFSNKFGFLSIVNTCLPETINIGNSASIIRMAVVPLFALAAIAIAVAASKQVACRRSCGSMHCVEQ